MQIVNKQTLIALLEDYVRDLTEGIQDAKDPGSYASNLQNSLLDFATSVSELGPSIDYWDRQDEIALNNEAAIDRIFGNMADRTLENFIEKCQKTIDISMELLHNKNGSSEERS